jgi:hypothetical protein
MKKWMMIVLLGALTAGLAVAEETKVPWYKKMFGKNADEQTQVIPPAPAAPASSPEMPRMQHREGAGEQRPHMQPSPEQAARMEKMKAQHEALMKLGEAARNETDPVKKEALVAELRAKVTEMVEKGQAEMKKRLDQAEKELPRLKEKMAEAEKNKAARIEEHVQRVLSGEPMRGPDGKRPDGKRPDGAPKKEGKKLPPPPVE